MIGSNEVTVETSEISTVTSKIVALVNDRAWALID